MAEMEVKGGGGHKKGKGVKKQKKLSTRVDLTPMVDLGFLLITFFMFATTLTTPTALKLTMPKEDVEEEEQNKMPDDGAFSILLGKDDGLFYYEGTDPSKLQTTNYKEIRDRIIDKQKRIRTTYGSDSADKKNMMVVIKPTDDATNKNVVDLLDEMKINAVKLYAIVKPTDQEKQVVALTQGGTAAPPAAPEVKK
jgi:biopolymer transport protein ExbD